MKPYGRSQQEVGGLPKLCLLTPFNTTKNPKIKSVVFMCVLVYSQKCHFHKAVAQETPMFVFLLNRPCMQPSFNVHAVECFPVCKDFDKQT